MTCVTNTSNTAGLFFSPGLQFIFLLFLLYLLDVGEKSVAYRSFILSVPLTFKHWNLLLISSLLCHLQFVTAFWFCCTVSPDIAPTFKVSFAVEILDLSFPCSLFSALLPPQLTRSYRPVWHSRTAGETPVFCWISSCFVLSSWEGWWEGELTENVAEGKSWEKRDIPIDNTEPWDQLSCPRSHNIAW